MNTAKTLEFDRILEQLANCAMSQRAQERARSLAPSCDERECRRWMQETTDARRVLDALGSPPLPSMKELPKILDLAQKESLLLPEQLTAVAQFLAAGKRMKGYLKRAEALYTGLSSYEGAIAELPELREEIDRCIRGDRVDDGASGELRSLRRKIESTQSEIRGKLDQLLRSKKEWFADGSAVMRNGRWVLPVKKQFRSQLGGTVVDTSATGGTCFMEPSSVARLREEISALEVEEDAEVRRILYTLSGMVDEQRTALRWNMEALETLDFAFAKAKLSAALAASPAELTADSRLVIRQGRHPLLNAAECVPLDFEVGGDVEGVVITGPNTGGKTVALKTVGLLSMMAQSGLHVPAGEGSLFCLRDAYLCDIGDGQSIEQNLSTFSSHIKNILAILGTATRDSLVLLDELGSGTDPAEGMGIAVAILEELRKKHCLFAATTHYPEVKEYAAQAAGLTNARMAFDRESLRPLYRLELGEAGESCALYIAKRLGLPEHMLERAYREAYASSPAQKPRADGYRGLPEELRAGAEGAVSAAAAMPKPPRLRREVREKPDANPSRSFRMGDSVEVGPDKAVGIVYQPADEMGMVCVQVKGVKKRYPYKRLRLLAAAETLYPPDYDFSIVFDTVDNRKARRKMTKRHDPGLTVTYENEQDWK